MIKKNTENYYREEVDVNGKKKCEILNKISKHIKRHTYTHTHTLTKIHPSL